MKKRLTALFLALALVCSLLPATVLFASAETYSGSCGDNLTWTLDTNTGLLTISGTGAMTYWSSSSSVPWNKYRNSIKTVTIGSDVTSIGNCAFGGCTGLTSIEIPDSVTSIGGSAFYDCTGLTSIDIPDSVTSIDNQAFYGCTGLTSIDIPDSVTSIGGSAFYDCAGLTSVTIGSGVTSIGKYAFSYCTVLTSIKVSDKNNVFDSRDNCNAIIMSTTNTMVIGCMSTSFPKSVTSIGRYAFSGCTGLTSIAIPDSVTSIGYLAFYGCTGLKSVTIGNGVTSIESYAFESCTGLTSVTIGSGVTSIGNATFEYCTGLTSIDIPDSVISIDYSAFRYCTGLTSVTIGNGVTSIGEEAFYGCTGLTSIDIPDSVTSIGEMAFRSCAGLTSVTIGNGVTSIESYAFESCTGLTKVNISDIAAWCKIAFDSSVSNPLCYAHNLYLNDMPVTVLSIPDSVTSIGTYAFYDCTGLTSVTIGSGVTSIGKYAFSSCTGLTSIKVSDKNTVYDSRSNCNAIIKTGSNILIVGCKNSFIPDSVISIGNQAFYGCTGLTSIEIPDSVTSIGNCAFSRCTGLTSIEIPGSVTSIGQYAFSRCTGLTSIEIPGSVTSIGICAFSGCTGLTSIEIPDGVTSIGNCAFSGCTGLTSIEIPDSVISIDYSAFRHCTGLTDVYYTGTEAQWQAIKIGSFNSCLTSATIHYSTAKPVNQLYITEISPNHAAIGSDSTIVLTFNQNVQIGSGTIEVRDAKNRIVGQFSVMTGLDSITADGKTVSINISGWNLKDGTYTLTITKRSFKTSDGVYFCGLSDKTVWNFEICTYKDDGGVMDYAQTGALWWKANDTTKPGIPDGTDSEYAQLLLNMAEQAGIENLSLSKIESLLDEPMYLPVTDTNGEVLLLNDKQTTIRQTLEDILFFESLKPFAESIDDELADVDKYNKSAGSNLNPLRQETEIYEELLGWYSQVDKYLSSRTECNPFFSSAAPSAYQALDILSSNYSGTIYSYTKPMLRAMLSTSITQKTLEGLSDYATYSQVQDTADKVNTLLKDAKTLGTAVYKAKTETGKAAADSVVKLSADLLKYTFSQSNNETLKKFSDSWSDLSDAKSTGELCAFLGSSIGAFPMVIDLYENLDTKEMHMAAAFYFIADYYVKEKYPEVYQEIFDSTGFPASDFNAYTFQATTGITGNDDPILYNWLSYLETISESVNRNRCRQLRYDLVNYILLLQYARDFDASSAKNALLQYISAECSKGKTATTYVSCPVRVDIYAADTNQLLASLSSEDESISSCEYGSLYLMGENNETKCVVLNSDAYYAVIVPYDDGVMNITVSVTDENGETSGKVFTDVALISGEGYRLTLDSADSGLEADNGETIAKDSTVAVNDLELSGSEEIAVGTSVQWTAMAYPLIATDRSLTWTSSDPAVAAVDAEGNITGVSEGTAVISVVSANEITAQKTVTVYTPATSLQTNVTTLSMVAGETYTLTAAASEGATHDIQWKSNNLNAVTVTEAGEITALETGSAIITASIDGLTAEVLVDVYASQVEVELYQVDLDGNAVNAVLTNHSCKDTASETAVIAGYESGRQIGVKYISAAIAPNESVKEKLTLPEFSENTTYSAVFYPLGTLAEAMQPMELLLVNGAYAAYDTTESAAAELPACKKETITAASCKAGAQYTLYVLTDDSGTATKENTAYIARKTAASEELTFTVCPAESAYYQTCYVYLSDSTGNMEQIATVIPHECEGVVTQPTCTEDGYITYTCETCGETDQVFNCTSLGHDFISHEAKGVTCTEIGWDAYQTCSRCDYTTYSEIPALGHSYDEGVISSYPTAAEDGTITYTCTECGDSYTEALTLTGQDDSIKMKRAALMLESDISICFYVLDEVLEGCNLPYVEFSKALYDASGNITGYQKELVTDFECVTTSDNLQCHLFRFKGINAAEMSSAITATLYARKSDGGFYQGKTVDYSVLTYATNMLSKTEDAKFKTLLVDLLNYGTAAQHYVNYNLTNLANAGLTDEQKACGTQEAPVLSSCKQIIKNEGATVYFKTCNLILREKVTVNYTLNTTSYEGNIDDLQVVFTYTDTNGEQARVTADSSTFTAETVNDVVYYTVSFTALNALQMKTALTAEVYNKTTGERVSDTAIYSIESYAYSKQEDFDETLVSLVNALMNYGNAASAYFQTAQ